MSLAEARIKLVELKNQRRQGICPAAERRRIEALEAQIREREERAAYTVEQMCEKYLRFYIEDRVADGRSIPGARSEKGQREVRRMFHVDVYPELGSKPASEVKRGDIISLIMKIVARGANVQAGSVLREVLAAHEFSIGLGRFDDDFVNPALSAKNSLRRTRITQLNCSKLDVHKQFVCPKLFACQVKEVKIHREGNKIILEPLSTSWDALLMALDEFPEDFMEAGRDQPKMQEREDI